MATVRKSHQPLQRQGRSKWMGLRDAGAGAAPLARAGGLAVRGFSRRVKDSGTPEARQPLAILHWKPGRGRGASSAEAIPGTLSFSSGRPCWPHLSLAAGATRGSVWRGCWMECKNFRSFQINPSALKG